MPAPQLRPARRLGRQDHPSHCPPNLSHRRDPSRSLLALLQPLQPWPYRGTSIDSIDLALGGRREVLGSLSRRLGLRSSRRSGIQSPFDRCVESNALMTGMILL